MEKIGYNINIDISVYFTLHHKDTGEEIQFTIKRINGIKKNGEHTIICYKDDYGSKQCKVNESYEEVKSLYKQALDKEEELYDTQKIIQKIPNEKIWDFCSKTSYEWWQIAMNKWNTLSDEEQKKYNQFIGFNDFSDYLMNIMAGTLIKFQDTGKLEYEEGSLLLEKRRPFLEPVIGTSNNVSMID